MRLPLACALLIALTFAASFASRPVGDWRSLVDASVSDPAASPPTLDTESTAILVAALQPRSLPGGDRIDGPGFEGSRRRAARPAFLASSSPRATPRARDDRSPACRFRDCGYLSAPPTAPPAPV